MIYSGFRGKGHFEVAVRAENVFIIITRVNCLSQVRHIWREDGERGNIKHTGAKDTIKINYYGTIYKMPMSKGKKHFK